VADALSDSSEEETLRALLRSLKACLILSPERAEEIASMDLDAYKSALDDEDLGQIAFDEDVDHAYEALEWRAIVVADLVREAMASYARARSPLDDPWVAWRRGPTNEPAGKFVQSLSEEEFFCARVAHHVHANMGDCRPSSIPTDGDLDDIAGCLETEYAPTWPKWLEVLGPPREATELSSAITAANHDLAEGHSGSTSELGTSIADLSDRVSAFQMPVIERLESIGAQVDALGAPDKFKAEEFLKEALGVEVYSYLSDDARTAALDAERRFRDSGTLDWNSVVANFAKAFEIQLKQRLVPRLAKYLEQRDVLEFPEDEYLPNRNPDRSPRKMQAIIKQSEAVRKLTLPMISIALGSTRPELQEFGRTCGFGLPKLKKLIDDMTLNRNRAAHETRMLFAEASRLREDWLGVTTGDGGIFGALLPKVA
jgi:hypothetical protein